MPKISRKELTRGVGLVPDHIHQPINDIQDMLDQGSVDQNQLDRGYSTFRVDLWSPHIGSQFIGPLLGWQGEKPFSIPFMLPPTQDFMEITAASGGFPTSYTITAETPQPVLTEVHFSFDQRGEGAAITDTMYNAGVSDWPSTELARQGKHGQLDYTNAREALNFKLSVVEKSPEIFQEDGSIQTTPDKEVYSIEIPADAFIGASFRTNPLVVTGINRTLNPYKTYVALLHCESLFKKGDYNLTENLNYALVSMNISLKFRMKLLPRDSHSLTDSEVQNIPVVHNGAATTDSDITPAPGVGSSIEAESPDGVHTAITATEESFRTRLQGGYTREGEAQLTHIQDDAGYEVISAALYANAINGGIAHSEASRWYFDGADAQNWARAIVPLNHPFVLHHVILAWNWQCWSNGYTTPPTPAAAVRYMPRTTGLYTAQVGVNLGMGLQSDALGFQSIAQIEAVDPLEGGSSTWLDSLVDRVRVHHPDLSIQNGEVQRQWDLIHVPITDGVINGKGFFAQGPPVWCGRSNQITAWNSRTSSSLGRSGINVGSNPTLKGQEQFLDIRAKISFSPNESAGDAEDILVGYGGHRIYLIGKKHLAGVTNGRRD